MIHTEKKNGFVLHIVTGECSIAEIIDCIKHHRNEWININSLWDFTGSTLANDIPNYNILKVKLDEIRDVIEGRAGKKSAFVVYDDGTFATMRMAISASDIIENRFEMCVFRDISEALDWLEN